jgi:serine/threonine-protein kinase
VTALDTGRLPRVERTSASAQTAPPSADATPVSRGSSSAYSSLRTGDYYPIKSPSTQELLQLERRWNDEPVQKFRRKLAPYLFVNGVIVVASIFGDSDFFGITVLWSIYLAFKYAKLWADGYDWRDVFRQPRDRDLIDVADDSLTYVRAMFNRDQRQAMRETRRARLSSANTPALPRSLRTSDAAVLHMASSYSEKVRQAEADRDEILLRLERMPSSERSRIPDVRRSAEALADKVKSLALALSDIDRTASAGGLDSIEAEIARLENAANPLDEAGSDERVRRLAKLKRERRALSDVTGRRDAIAAKLDTCLVALQNIRLDLIRLNAGDQSPHHVTSLAMDALNLADSVDIALAVGDDNGRTTATRPASRPAAR